MRHLPQQEQSGRQAPRLIERNGFHGYERAAIHDRGGGDSEVEASAVERLA
jgi:hypothetical protein